MSALVSEEVVAFLATLEGESVLTFKLTDARLRAIMSEQYQPRTADATVARLRKTAMKSATLPLKSTALALKSTTLRLQSTALPLKSTPAP